MSFTPRDDVNLLQAAHPAVVGAGMGNDRYILDSTLMSANQRLMLSDNQGSNTLHLVSGLEVVSSKVSVNALQLTLNNGAEVTVLGANTFQYQTGGNSINGIGALVQNFSTFVTQALKTSVPTSSTVLANGGSVTVQPGGETLASGTDSPIVLNVAITSATGAQNNTLNAGDVVSITVTMSEATTVTGTPQLTLNIGGNTVQANYASGSGTTALVFTYAIQPMQTDANGIGIAANSLGLNNGTIKDSTGNNATLTHTAVADNAGYQVDGAAPRATLIAPTGAFSTVQLGGLEGSHQSPQITALDDDGQFSVAWQGTDGQGNSHIFVQPFNADGGTTGQTQAQLQGSELANTGNFGAQIQAFGTAGSYVVAWTGFKSTTSNDTAIFVQRFNADGTTTGQAPTTVEAPQYPAGIDGSPQITALPSGGFVVSWQGVGNGLYTRIFLQVFNADGSRASDTATELPAIDRPSGHDEQHQLAALGTTGNLAVAWQGDDVMVNGAGYRSIYVQVLNASGQALRQPAVLLNGSGLPDGNDMFPRIAALGSGGAFVVTWYGYESAGDASIFVQMFNADGSTTGHPTVRLEAIGKTNGDDLEPQITAVGSNGEFVVTWWGEDNDGDPGDGSIFVQKFNADGTTTGQTPVQLEAIGRTNGDDRSPQIAAVGSQGEFVVTWYGRDETLGDESIFVQKFNANGTTTGQTPVQLEAVGELLGDDYLPQIAAVGSQGEFAVTWHGKDSQGDLSVFVQKFLADGCPLGRMVSVDSGSTVTVRSTEPGMAYLVNTSVAVGSVADITGAADALWNAVAVTTANTDTALSATGLQAGTYQLYTADAAGNLSAAATPTVEIVGTGT